MIKSSALTTVKKISTNTTFLTAGAAAIAIALSACGSAGSTDAAVPGAEAAVTTVAAPVTAPVTEAPADTTAADESTDEAPAPAATTQAPATDADDYPLDQELIAQQFIPASGIQIPCSEYTVAESYPLFPCEKGPLVEDLQDRFVDRGWVLDVDGFYGEETMELVQTLQRAGGMYDTGVMDQLLFDLLGLGEDIPEIRDGHDVDGYRVDSNVYSEDQIIERCNAVLDFDPTIEVTDELIIACDDVDVRIVSGD